MIIILKTNLKLTLGVFTLSKLTDNMKPSQLIKYNYYVKQHFTHIACF